MYVIRAGNPNTLKRAPERLLRPYSTFIISTKDGVTSILVKERVIYSCSTLLISTARLSPSDCPTFDEFGGGSEKKTLHSFASNLEIVSTLKVRLRQFFWVPVCSTFLETRRCWIHAIKYAKCSC